LAATLIRCIACDIVGSTNGEALARARAGETGPLWITARAQTAGRGRRGRVWLSPPGNLYATLLLCDPSPPERAPQVSFVAALAAHDAIAEIAADARPRLTLKWPNDLLCDGAKVAGILIEGEGSPVVLAVGIGVNCAHHPDEAAYPATDLRAAGLVVAPESLFEALSRTMVARLRQWDRGRGFAAIRADWLARAHGLGGDIRVRLPEREVAGRFEALDRHGRLVLRRADGSAETVSAGDVFPINRGATAAAEQ